MLKSMIIFEAAEDDYGNDLIGLIVAVIRYDKGNEADMLKISRMMEVIDDDDEYGYEFIERPFDASELSFDKLSEEADGYSVTLDRGMVSGTYPLIGIPKWNNVFPDWSHGHGRFQHFLVSAVSEEEAKDKATSMYRSKMCPM